MMQHFFERAWQGRGWRAWLLAPFSVITWCFTHRTSRPPRPSSDWPKVVIVGNLLAGGTGKTPLLIAIAQELTQRQWRVGVVTRGHGAVRSQDPVYICHVHSQVHRQNEGQEGPLLHSPESDRIHAQGDPHDPRQDPLQGPQQGLTRANAQNGGDEAALIAQAAQCPVAAHPRRARALARLMQDYPDLQVVLSDDGLQHAALERHIELLLVDERGWGNGWLLPAGPLREPSQRAQSVDAILHRGNALLREELGLSHRPCFGVTAEPAGWWHPASGQRCDELPAEVYQASAEGRLQAWAGISRPERFFSSLRALGLLVQPHPLADHAAPSEYDLRVLPPNTLVVMTAKDAVKCDPDPRVWVLLWRAGFDNPEFFTWLEQKLHGSQND